MLSVCRRISELGVGTPGKQVVRCSISASCVTGFLAEFIVEMAKQRISPRGINCDWLIGDILIGDTSPDIYPRDAWEIKAGGKCLCRR